MADNSEQHEHPLGIEPWGSRLLRGGSSTDVRSAGLGALACLDDTLVLLVLGLLPAADLARLSTVSKAAYCFANHEPLWKALAVEELGDITYSTSWRETYIRGIGHASFRQRDPLRMAGFHSDVLYQSWHFARAELDARWLERDNIPRRAASRLTQEQFREQFEAPNRPVILTGEVGRWPAFKKWTQAHLRRAFAGRRLNAGGCLLSWDSYLAYSAGSRDELPLYLFDKQCLGWRDEASQRCLADDYEAPQYFAEDLFSVLGEGRPDWRWLIRGPPKSGSSFHKDPNSTSAWNAVISGSKKWVLWPPHSPPPGVYPSADGLQVSSPYTLHEWFDSFYEYAREEPNMLEGICRAGELLFVPRGWWHMAVNLEETTAITQNYVSSCNLRYVMAHLRQPHLVSGCALEQRASLHDRFVDALREHRPQALEQLAEAQAAKKRKAAQSQALSSLFTTAKSSGRLTGNEQRDAKRARTAVDCGNPGGDADSTGSFSFGFAL